jgi:uncharacterized membrane protein
MMSLPFFTAAAAIALGWCNLRTGAAVLAVAAVVVTLALFAMHATDSLNLEL